MIRMRPLDTPERFQHIDRKRGTLEMVPISDRSILPRLHDAVQFFSLGWRLVYFIFVRLLFSVSHFPSGSSPLL